MVVLETPRLYLRRWVLDDWVRFRVLATDLRVLRYIGNGHPWSDERIKRFVNGGIEIEKQRGWILWPVISKDDWQLVGICGFNDGFAPDVEIGWWLRPEYWGKGLATEAASAVMAYGFKTFHFPRLISVAQPDNVRSIRVMEKLGMAFDRTFVHDGLDVVAYSRTAPLPEQSGVDTSLST